MKTMYLVGVFLLNVQHGCFAMPDPDHKRLIINVGQYVDGNGRIGSSEYKNGADQGSQEDQVTYAESPDSSTLDPGSSSTCITQEVGASRTCDCVYILLKGCRISQAALSATACECTNVNGNSCVGTVVDCQDPASRYCEDPDTSLDSCLQAPNSNCGGYLPECPPPWVSIGKGCYLFVEFFSNWDVARANCVAKGGDLAVIDTLTKQTNLVHYMKTHLTSASFWLGATTRSGMWTWVINETVTTGWYQNQDRPHFTGVGNWCMYIPSYDGMYDLLFDAKCSYKFRSICEKITYAESPDSSTSDPVSSSTVTTQEVEASGYCDCDYVFLKGCKISTAAPPATACECTNVNGSKCEGTVVNCIDPSSIYCTDPDIYLNSCLQASHSNCGGYR